MSDMASEYTPRQFTVEEYHRLAELGVFGAGERLELLDGIIAEMSPIGPRHSGRHARVVRDLLERIGDRAVVVGQGSFVLSATSEPQPDIAIVAAGYDDVERPFRPEEVLAIIEIAQSSLPKDLGPKLRLYARSRIRDYLVVDLDDNALIHFSNPHDLGYSSAERLGSGETFTLERLPGVTFSADPFLAPQNP